MPPLSAPVSDNVEYVTYSHFCRWPSQKPAASPVTVLVSYTLTLNQFLPARTVVESHRIHSGYFWRRFYVFFLLKSKKLAIGFEPMSTDYKSAALPTVLCQQKWRLRDLNPDALLPWKGSVITFRPSRQNVRYMTRTCDLRFVRTALSQLS